MKNDKLDKIESFLEELSLCGIIQKSAEKSGISYGKILEMRSHDAAFKARMDKAVAESSLILEDEAKRRALEGTEETIYYKGCPVGTKVKYNDALLINVLKAGSSSKYSGKSIDTNIDMGKILDGAIKRLKGEE